MIGQKQKDDQVLLTLIERKSRQFLVRRISAKTAQAVMAEFDDI